MSGLKAGEQFPEGVKFKYIPWTTADTKVCGFPVTYDASKEFANKKVVLVSVPGAFTPTCSANHVPRYIEHIADLKNKGVDTLLIIAPNDAYVMSGWQKVNTIDTTDPSANTSIIFASDLETKLAAQIGWTAPGDRNGRWAAVIDHGKVTYAEVETELQAVSVSGVEAVLKAL
ncbi:Peroxiredoxin Pen c 3 [Fulvia fulva]|uniref:Peroxiredoxin Pen c 3 n=1 Tax=Passalora fulva TaxID=5499 RepID=A0A9Q8UVQ6_PASFU|nr:Peroxiredoxin Pen c 3 [Fulvia fulva]KAK4611951.1 Peroxiredoxin Pen c 3 [Fulvia fulva]KAK4612690.1 Peroxiredoxin Pen c 3 [Fulvia fulva]UJO24117.1 Peroxiredoxin Pen c 3 [Fulvia fulva]WPV21444.1 Peroxiredoxin Pen c 3 [Fulvia fulva]WPV36480.1 Peroxiredoxin Pen c 3 [Fulvia fulva]